MQIEKSIICFLIFYLFFTNTQMKTFMKIGALSLALVASLLMLSNTTKADTGTLTLKINTGTNSCVFGTSLDLWSQWMSFISALTFSGYFTGTQSTFSCTSNNGQNVSLSLQSSNLTNATSQSISSGVVTLQTNPNRVSSWSCLTGAGTTSRTSISSAQIVLSKNNNPGQVCIVSVTGIQLKVVAPIAQAIGTYTWTLTITQVLNN